MAIERRGPNRLPGRKSTRLPDDALPETRTPRPRRPPPAGITKEEFDRAVEIALHAPGIGSEKVAKLKALLADPDWQERLGDAGGPETIADILLG